jgi:haloalkane dehalogenase
MKDPVIKKHYLEKFVSGFTNSRTLKLESSGHFPQEEQPEDVAKAISTLQND